jgi:hypothetical protein
MPDNAKILLDRCVVNSDDKPQSLDYQITYDFFLLEPTGMFLLKQMFLMNHDPKILQWILQ